MRLLRADGTIEVYPDEVDADFRYRSDDIDGWVSERHEADRSAITLAIAHVMVALATGQTPELSADKALRASEIIFGAWESASSHGRVDFPLEADGNALTDMVESGEIVLQ